MAPPPPKFTTACLFQIYQTVTVRWTLAQKFKDQLPAAGILCDWLTNMRKVVSVYSNFSLVAELYNCIINLVIEILFQWNCNVMRYVIKSQFFWKPDVYLLIKLRIHFDFSLVLIYLFRHEKCFFSPALQCWQHFNQLLKTCKSIILHFHVECNFPSLFVPDKNSEILLFNGNYIL